MIALEDITDIKIDLKTGFTIIDSVTNDAVIISGYDVVLQTIALELQTQIGTVKRQILNNYGWNKLGALKRKITEEDISTKQDLITRIILKNERVEDAEVAITQDPINDNITISANVRINSLIFPLTVTI